MTLHINFLKLTVSKIPPGYHFEGQVLYSNDKGKIKVTRYLKTPTTPNQCSYILQFLRYNNVEKANIMANRF